MTAQAASRTPPAPLVDTRRSPHARLRTLSHASVTLESGGFWASRCETNRSKTLPEAYCQLVEAGNVHNLQLAAGIVGGEFKGPRYMDSDLYKWMEAAALSIATHPDDTLASILEELAAIVARVQMPDGYLNAYFQTARPDDRWSDLTNAHELYCAGHFIQAAVAHHRATGERPLLDVAIRLADHVDATFGPGRRDGTPGHPEIELALVELARHTGERRYIDLAGFFIDRRGQSPPVIGGRAYHLDHVPVREAESLAGHAVRQLYLLSGMVDLFLETGEAALLDASRRLWTDLVEHKLHIHGGVGARHDGEAFGEPYELPNDRTYSETCGQIASVMWNWRMLLATGHSRYADLMEWTLYNGFLSGVNLEGDRFFYPNTLLSRGGVERQRWFGCACCPPNVARLLASIGHYIATTDDSGVQVHLFDRATIRTPFATIRMTTDYPWEEEVALEIVEVADPEGMWTLSIRDPAWCRHVGFRLNGEAAEPDRDAHGSLHFTRAWRPGDRLVAIFDMPVRLIEAHPDVEAARGAVAIERGPLLYCLEQAGFNERTPIMNVTVDPRARFEIEHRAELLGGVRTIEFDSPVEDRRDWEGALYRARRSHAVDAHQTRLQAIPYHLWANRGPVPIRVWLPLRDGSS